MSKPQFNLPPGLEEQKNALVTGLGFARGFALYFVVCEGPRVRPRLMDEIAAGLPGKTVQRIDIPASTTNLLPLLQNTLTDPLPDIVFVSGLENQISGAAHPRSHPLLLNLNATRNNLYTVAPRPLVFWVPPFVLKAIVEAAPDFISVRSGVYSFPLDPEERQSMTNLALTIGQTEILGLDRAERENHIAEMQSLLNELRSLPDSQRNPLDEAQILNQLGIAHYTLGKYAEAELYLVRALATRCEIVSNNDVEIANSLNSLAILYQSQGRLSEAEPLHNEALALRRKALPELNFS